MPRRKIICRPITDHYAVPHFPRESKCKAAPIVLAWQSNCQHRILCSIQCKVSTLSSWLFETIIIMAFHIYHHHGFSYLSLSWLLKSIISMAFQIYHYGDLLNLSSSWIFKSVIIIDSQIYRYHGFLNLPVSWLFRIYHYHRFSYLSLSWLFPSI